VLLLLDLKLCINDVLAALAVLAAMVFASVAAVARRCSRAGARRLSALRPLGRQR